LKFQNHPQDPYRPQDRITRWTASETLAGPHHPQLNSATSLLSVAHFRAADIRLLAANSSSFVNLSACIPAETLLCGLARMLPGRHLREQYAAWGGV